MATDRQGTLLAVHVTAANQTDGAAAGDWLCAWVSIQPQSAG